MWRRARFCIWCVAMFVCVVCEWAEPRATQGASNMPAWKVAQANEYARGLGKPQFVIYQGEWSVLNRDVERDILPMCREYGTR